MFHCKAQLCVQEQRMWLKKERGIFTANRNSEAIIVLLGETEGSLRIKQTQ